MEAPLPWSKINGDIATLTVFACSRIIAVASSGGLSLLVSMLNMVCMLDLAPFTALSSLSGVNQIESGHENKRRQF